MHIFKMFITAVCFIFLIKLRCLFYIFNQATMAEDQELYDNV